MNIEIVSRHKNLSNLEVSMLRERIVQGLAYFGARIYSTRMTVTFAPNRNEVSVALNVHHRDTSTTVVRRVGKVLLDTLDQAISRTQVCVTRHSDRSIPWRVGTRSSAALRNDQHPFPYYQSKQVTG